MVSWYPSTRRRRPSHSLSNRVFSASSDDCWCDGSPCCRRSTSARSARTIWRSSGADTSRDPTSTAGCGARVDGPAGTSPLPWARSDDPGVLSTDVLDELLDSAAP
eukprot:scaffold15016_cov107-Isochrysis_galbana.AAC.3